MLWEFPVVSKFWCCVISALVDILDIWYASNPGFCRLNDNCGITLKQIQLKMVFAGFTTAKKKIFKKKKNGLPQKCVRSFLSLNVQPRNCTILELSYSSRIIAQLLSNFYHDLPADHVYCFCVCSNQPDVFLLFHSVSLSFYFPFLNVLWCMIWL